MDRNPLPEEDDQELRALIKSRDDAHDELERNGPVSAQDLRRGLDAIYARKRDEASLRAKAVND